MSVFEVHALFPLALAPRVLRLPLAICECKEKKINVLNIFRHFNKNVDISLTFVGILTINVDISVLSADINKKKPHLVK